ncbi:MAG TPA: T9SS type A sorting domain-containing protein [Bacteroidia bacterium]|nr:T9SS type A sorting domain-containing protein [Bacteroidia bacterium]
MYKFLRLLLTFILVFVVFKIQATNFYSYQSGDWGAAFIWTTDPSGTTLVGSATPSAADNVFILNGRNITTALARTVLSCNIQGGGSLDLGTSVGHNLGTVSGEGLLRLSSVSFPTGTFTSFVSSTGGTIEYYDIGGAGTNLPTQTTYNNLIFSNSTGVNQTLIFPSAAAVTYTVNGSVTVLRSAAGTMNLLLASAAFVINLNISKNLTIGEGCSLMCANFNAIHNIRVGIDFTNNGIVDLSNSAQFVASTNGAANVIFNGLQNSNFICNNQTDVYSLQVNKGTDQTYILSVISNNVNNLKLFTDGTALVITAGTMRLTENNSFTRINGGGNFDVSTSQNEAGCLWIDGANMLLDGSANAIVVYGKFRMSAGNFSIGREGLVIRIAGEILFEGGVSTIEKYRSSTIVGFHIGSFTMTGGILNVDGTTTGSSNADSPRFSHPFPGQSFKMTGGTINVSAPETGTAVNGGILIGNDAANILVTGGTWNVTIPASATNFNICSTAPFYNMNIIKAGAGAAVVTLANQTIGPNVIEVYRPNPVLAQPLVILNDLNIVTGNSPNLSAGTSNVVIGRNFNLQNATTYSTGANTTVFNGAQNQTFTINGTISPSLNNLTIQKPLQRTLNLAGSASTLEVNGTLSIILGTLADGNKIINVYGNIVNSGNHSGAGSIRLTGTGAQQIGGDGTGKFNNLILNKTSGSSTLTANQTINGTLRLANTAAILDLSVYNLSLGTTNNIYDDILGTGTNFNNAKMLRTAGNASDGGLTKRFSASATSFTYPLGTNTDYTPGSLTITGTPTAYGAVTMRPANNEQANVTATNRSLTYHWRVTSSGMTVGPATVSQTFNYVASKVVVGPDVFESEYIAAKYRPSTNSWVKGTTAHVNTTTKTLTFSSAVFGTVLDGDYTAGDDTPTDPFGTVVVYYSMRSGNWDDVNLATTPWSIVSNSGPAAGTIPGPNSPVQIGNGSGIFHTITVSNNNKTCGSIVIGNNSVLDLGTTTGHNFGIYTAGSINNAGTLKISSLNPIAEFPAGDFGIFLSAAGGTMEYYTTGAVDFTIPTISANPSLAPLSSYRNLTLRPAAAQYIEMPNNDLLVRSSLTIVGGGTTGTVRLNSAATRSLNVTQNIAINSGVLSYRNGFAQDVIVGNNVTINNNASFEVLNAGTAVNNTLTVSGTLTNNGTMNFDAGSSRVCNLTFKGNSNKLFTGTNGAATTVLNLLTIDKGTTSTPTLTLDVAGSLTTPSNNWLSLLNGTFILAKASTLSLTNAAVTSYTIPSTAALTVNNAGATVNIGMFADDSNDLFLAGKLEINSGTVNIGNAANNNNNDIEYVAASTPSITLTGGNLNVNGQIRRSTTVTTGFLSYSQSGSSAVLIRGRNQNAIRAKLEIVNPSSVFNMSGNATLTIERGGGTTFSDLYLDPSSNTVTGGTVVFNSTGTGANQTYNLDSNIPLFNVTITGNAGETATGRLPVSELILKGSLIISNVNSIFNTNSRNVTVMRDFTNLNTTATTGLNVGGYRPISATQTTYFKGSSNNQTITGVSGNLTNFANLVIENTFLSGTVTVAPNSNLRVNNVLTLNEGTFATVLNTVTTIGNVYNQSVHTSVGAGAIVLAGSALQYIDGDNFGIFGSLTLNNAAGAQTYADMTVNGTLTLTNGIIYIDNNLLNMGSSATVSGTFSATRMIRTNGAISDSGIVKNFAAGASSFTYPIGVTGKYTPVTYNVTANGAVGAIQVRPVNAKHPATTDAAALELNYYWLVNGTGFSGLTLTHVYNYINADVNGTEASYVTGRFLSNAWTPLLGIAGTVNAGANTMTLTGVNFINGAYTAGESSEFNVITDLYSRNATLGGNWSDVNSWSATGHGGAPAGVVPTFQNVFIAPGHTITADNNFHASSNIDIDGTLDLGSFIGHNFGIVTGIGRLRITTTASNNFVFPAGNYSSFISSTGGTVEYYSNTNGNLLTQQYYNNLEFTGSGIKSLTNVDLGVNGNFSILGGTVNNAFNRDIDIRGNWVNNVSSTAFTAGTGTVRFLGANQNIGGSSSTNFYNLTSAGTGTKTLGRSQIVNNNLLISLNSTLDVSASNFAIDLKGNFTANGVFNSQQGTVTLLGIVQQQILGTGNPSFYNLTLQNSAGASLNAPASLINTLTCNIGNFINNATTFTLLSTASNTARIAPLLVGTYTGEITMQRFAPGPVTGWSFISAPVNNAKINQWTDDFPTSGFTGSMGYSGGFISIYYYEETASGVWDSPTSYVPVTNAATNSIIPGVGCWVYLGTSLGTTSDITIDVTGDIVKGDFDFAPTNTFSGSGVANDGWNLFANPYPSAIDWDAASGWNKLNVNDAIYIYQADLDQYATYIAGVGVNGGSRYIASSQGFFVKTVSSPILTCTEQVKHSANPTFLKAGENPTTGKVLSVKLKGINNYNDEMAIRFHNEATMSFDPQLDGAKIGSSNTTMPYIATVMEDLDYSINSLSDVDLNYEIPVRVKVGVAGNYTFSFDGIKGLDDISCLVFEDRLTGIITNLKTENSYSCFLSDTALAPRFYIKSSALLPKSVTNTSCENKHDGKIAIINPNLKVQKLILSDIDGNQIVQKQSAEEFIEFTQLDAGTYVVLYENNLDCNSLQDTVEVLPGIAIHAQFSLKEDTLYLNESNLVELQNLSENALEYQWNVGSFTSSEFTPSLTIHEVGTQTINLSASNNGCFANSSQQITVIAKRAQDLEPRISNFNNGAIIHFDFKKNTDVQIRVLNALGQMVQEPVNMEVQQQNYLLDLSAFSHGVYFVDLIYNQQKLTSKIQF